MTDPCLIYPDTIIYPWTIIYPRGLCGTRPVSTRGLNGCIVPAYNYPSPTTTWDAWISGAPAVTHMIADPGSPGGPGTFTDTNYVAAIAHAQANDIIILGYVDTNYAAVDTAVAEGQIDDWFTLYGIRDIFFDRVSSSISDLSYYLTLVDYAKNSGATTVMLNPGTNPDEGYFNINADIICVFEGSQTDFDSYSAPEYLVSYPSSMIAHLIYGVPTVAQMRADENRSLRLGAGYVYITDDTLADFPWDDLPTYWDEEIAVLDYDLYAGSSGGGGSFEPLPTDPFSNPFKR